MSCHSGLPFRADICMSRSDHHLDHAARVRCVKLRRAEASWPVHRTGGQLIRAMQSAVSHKRREGLGNPATRKGDLAGAGELLTDDGFLCSLKQQGQYFTNDQLDTLDFEFPSAPPSVHVMSLAPKGWNWGFNGARSPVSLMMTSICAHFELSSLTLWVLYAWVWILHCSGSFLEKIKYIYRVQCQGPTTPASTLATQRSIFRKALRGWPASVSSGL